MLVGAALGCLMGVGVAPANAAEAQWQLYDLNGDGCYEAALIDRDFNGYSEDQWLNIDNDCEWDTRMYNTVGGDWFAEELSYDMDENGLPEYVLQDTDQREGFDYVWFDLNQDAVYEAVTTMSAAQASTIAAESTVLEQTNITNMNDAILATMPGHVATVADLPSITPVELLP